MTIEFEHIHVTGLNMGGMRQVACGECGAFIVDWARRSSDDPAPNQEKHRAFHEAAAVAPLPVRADG